MDLLWVGAGCAPEMPILFFLVQHLPVSSPAVFSVLEHCSWLQSIPTLTPCALSPALSSGLSRGGL